LISRICNILITLLLAIVFVAAGLLLVPQLAGYKPYGVLSGSMEPAFPVGGVVYVKETAAEDIKVGEAITFNFGDDSKTVVTHRVVAVNEPEQLFTTKGDANQANDADPVPFNKLLGKAVFGIPYLGYVSLYMRTREGILTGTALLMLIIVLSLVGDIFKKKEKSLPDANKAEVGIIDKPGDPSGNCQTDNIDKAGNELQN